MILAEFIIIPTLLYQVTYKSYLISNTIYIFNLRKVVITLVRLANSHNSYDYKTSGYCIIKF